jgi:hypothetical protein
MRTAFAVIVVLFLPKLGLADPAEEVSRAEGSASYVRLDQIRSDRDLERDTEHLETCLAATATARAAGMSPSKEVRVGNSDDYPSTRTDKQPGRVAVYYAPLGEVEARCKTLLPQVRVLPVAWALSEVLATKQRMETLDKPDPDFVVLARLARDRCTAAADAALAKEVPASQPVKTDTVELTLGEVKEKGCDAVLGAMKQTQDAVTAAKDAEFAPYRKALKGDKLKLFMDRNMIHFRVYGPGGRELATPAALARADVWFEGINTRTRLHWAMKRFQFKNGKLVSETRVTGSGPMPPSKAYR